ncbi:MAG TPA: hypothetical protein VF272_00390, partial [Candidatus Saccharimonadia bacterium]
MSKRNAIRQLEKREVFRANWLIVLVLLLLGSTALTFWLTLHITSPWDPYGFKCLMAAPSAGNEDEDEDDENWRRHRGKDPKPQPP